MAGPLMVFGFMVLPPLAARSLAGGMSGFFTLSSLVGVAIAVFGFYLSVRLDLPLGPTDVAFGCLMVFILYGVQLLMRKKRAVAMLLLFLLAVGSGCATPKALAPLETQHLAPGPIWLASVRNGTASDLRLPSTNPLRSLAELAGRLSPDYRPTVMDVLRGSLRKELEQRRLAVSLPEERDVRLQSFPFDGASATANARSANLSGWLFLSEIRRWHTDGRAPLRATVNFLLVRIDDGVVSWARQINKTVPVVASGRLDDASLDAIKEILRDVFGA
jgi:hypothetical protein